MTEPIGAARSRAETALGVGTSTLWAVIASTVLTSLATVALSGADTSRTLTVGDFWSISFPISIFSPALVYPALTMHMAKLLRDLRRARDELLSVTQKDPLTGLLNRRGFDLAAVRVFAESRRSGAPIAALMCDIDMFKAVNDEYGHEFGDLALQGVAEVLRASIGTRGAALARQGGEEFVILLPGVDFAKGVEIAEIVRAACAANRFESKGVATRITLSIGVASQAPWGADPRALLSCADAALYQAKRDGRNRVVSAVAPHRP
jgi:diguanylate cyclase (GGDEF)-like protein